MVEEAVTKETDEQKADAVAEQQTDADAATQTEETPDKGHDFNKGLSRLQSRQKKYEKSTDDKLSRILDRLEQKAEPTQTESKAADALDKYLEGRDPDDVPTVRDMMTLMQQVGGNRGPDGTAIAKAVQEAVAPLIKAKEESDQKAYWAQFYRQHPDLDEDTTTELWSEAGEMAEEDGGSQSEREAAARAHFKHLVKSKERSLKRQKTPSTKSPTSPDGTQVEKAGASTAAAPESKRSMEDLYRAADSEGKL